MYILLRRDKGKAEERYESVSQRPVLEQEGEDCFFLCTLTKTEFFVSGEFGLNGWAASDNGQTNWQE